MSKQLLLRVLPLVFIVIILAGLALIWTLNQAPTSNNVFSNIATTHPAP